MLVKSIAGGIALVSLSLLLLSPSADAQGRRPRHYNQNDNQQVQQGNDLYEQENARAEEQARQLRMQQQQTPQPGYAASGEAPTVRGTVGGAAPYAMSVMPETLPPAKGSAESWGLKDNFPIPIGQDDAATFALPQAPANAPGPATGPRTHRFR